MTLLQEAIKSEKPDLVVTKAELLHSFNVTPNRWPQMTSVCRQSPQSVEGGLGVFANERSNHSSGRFPAAVLLAQLADGIGLQSTPSNQPIKEARDQLGAADCQLHGFRLDNMLKPVRDSFDRQ
jgi:hypothetical protein